MEFGLCHHISKCGVFLASFCLLSNNVVCVSLRTLQSIFLLACLLTYFKMFCRQTRTCRLSVCRRCCKWPPRLRTAWLISRPPSLFIEILQPGTAWSPKTEPSRSEVQCEGSDGARGAAASRPAVFGICNWLEWNIFMRCT